LAAYRLSLPYERPPLRRRASRLALAVAVNLLLFLIMLSLGARLPVPKGGSAALVVSLLPQPDKAATEASKTEPLRPKAHRPVPKPPPIVLPAKPTIRVEKPLPMIELSKEEYAATDVGALPKAIAASSAAQDSKAVGRGPNGEVLYAAEWAREPTDAELGGYLQPKCGDKRMGYCDEPVKEWELCPLGKVRPHKEQLLDVFRQYKAGNLVALREEDLRAVEDAGNEE
jgi:hypothetical protein